MTAKKDTKKCHSLNWIVHEPGICFCPMYPELVEYLKYRSAFLFPIHRASVPYLYTVVRRTNLFAFKLSNTALLVSVPGLIAIFCVGTPLLPKAPNIRMNIIGNNKLNTMDIGLSKNCFKTCLCYSPQGFRLTIWLRHLKKLVSKPTGKR